MELPPIGMPTSCHRQHGVISPWLDPKVVIGIWVDGIWMEGKSRIEFPELEKMTPASVRGTGATRVTFRHIQFRVSLLTVA